MDTPKVVSHEEWLAARRAHLAREKELTRLRDQLAAERRALPWVKVEKPYVFEGPDGPVTLADLFAGRSQLVIQHFMFGPDWSEGCKGCSFQADHNDAAFLHLAHHDVSFAAVSRASLAQIEVFKERMGWRFTWVSAAANDFNRDYHVSYTAEDIGQGTPWIYNFQTNAPLTEESEGSGISVFYRNEAGDIFHTYSAYARGTEQLVGAYNYLDLTPKGRNETGPGHNMMDWLRHHDRYVD